MLDLLENIVETNKVLAYGAIFFLAISIALLIAIPLESRQVLGINLWIKPLKFSISILIFLVTSIYLLDVLPYSKFKTNLFSWILLLTMLFEIFCIVFQAARAQLSHFNITDPIGSVMFPLMGFAVAVAYLVYAVVLLDYFRLPVKTSDEVLWAIRFGIIILLFGGISGMMMASGLKHTVGISDGGVGLPFTNWSTVAGDLRVSHFFSLHAIQVLPLLAILVSNYSTFLPFNSLIAILTASVMYLSFSVLTLIQAINGKPFISI